MDGFSTRSPPAVHWSAVSRTFAVPGRAPVRALAELELELVRGERLCLIGPSGSGKTTTLRLANGLETPSSGRVLVHGRDVGEWDPIRLRRGIGYVVQNGGLLPHRTVADNVGLLLEVEGWSRVERERRVTDLLERVHLDPTRYAPRFPFELSGGERQRVGIARALALDPPLCFLDEPFGALDPITRRELQREFAELSADRGRTMLIVTHDMAEAFRLGDRIALFDRGTLVQIGTPQELRDAPVSAFVERFLEVLT